MAGWISNLLVLAQDKAAAPAAAPAEGANGQQGGGLGMLVLMLPVLLFFGMSIFMSGRQQKKDQSRRDTMIRGLKKNDSVVTIGGIIGTVVNVSEDASEVTLKMVDDSRIKFRADAIRDVLNKPEPAAEKS